MLLSQHEVPAILKSRLTGNIHKLIDMEPDWVLVEVEAGDKGKACCVLCVAACANVGRCCAVPQA